MPHVTVPPERGNLGLRAGDGLLRVAQPRRGGVGGLLCLLGLALGGVDFSNFFLVLKGDHALDTLTAAKAAKAVTLNYGLFINAIINFLIVAFALFMMLRQLNKLVAPNPATDAAPPPSEEVLLLREIRDSLKTRA